MHVRFGSQIYSNVKVPLLWGKRAVIGHPSGELSIVDLSGSTAQPEVVANVPWYGVEYSESEDGYVVFKDNLPAYFFSPLRKLLRDQTGVLPEAQILENETRIGTNRFRGNVIHGFQVGIGVSEDGFSMAGPLPAALAELLV